MTSATEAVTRTIKLLKDIGADADRKGLDPVQHLSGFLATLPVETAAGITVAINAIREARKSAIEDLT
jgi:hypothetical protein